MLAFIALITLTPPTQPQPGRVLAGLTGACWQADMGGGKTDTHCFSAADPLGELALDIHKVRDAEQKVIYEGVTTYRIGSENVVFDYYNSFGSRMPGTISRAGDDITALLTLPNGSTQEVHWHLNGDSYDATGAFPAPIHYRKIGPVGDGGF
jgi:hypothetical protein